MGDKGQSISSKNSLFLAQRFSLRAHSTCTDLMFVDQLPQAVSNRAKALGQSGEDWLKELDQLATRILSEHHLQPGKVLHGGTESLVIEASTAQDQAVVVKFGLPGSADSSREAFIYQLAQGHGYARLAFHDAAHNVLAVEKLGPPLQEENRPDDEAIKVLCEQMMHSWLDLDATTAAQNGLMNGADKADWHINFLQQQQGTTPLPCSSRVIDTAISYAQLRKAAHTPVNARLVHGDAHSLNTLKAPDGGYKFIDPEGLFGEIALDLCIPMREYNEGLLQNDTANRALARCHMISTLANADPTPIWQWGFVERVSSAFVLASVGMQSEAQQTFEVAELIVATNV